MSGNIVHDPSDVIQQLLVDFGKGILGGEEGDWPIYSGLMPDQEDSGNTQGPDDVIAVFGTEGRLFGRDGIIRQMDEHYGIQIRVRSGNVVSGRGKAQEIVIMLDEEVYQVEVVLGEYIYTVHSIMRTASLTPLGMERTSRRRNWVINAVVSMSMASAGTGTGSGSGS